MIWITKTNRSFQPLGRFNMKEVANRSSCLLVSKSTRVVRQNHSRHSECSSVVTFFLIPKRDQYEPLGIDLDKNILMTLRGFVSA